MRLILVDRARRRHGAKNGGNAEKLNADEIELTAPAHCDELHPDQYAGKIK